MNITIEQRKFAIRSEYDISGPGLKYYAEKKLFSFPDRLKVQTADGRFLGRIKGYFSIFSPKYDFEFSNGTTYRFRCESLWKGVYSCENAEERFLLYEHKGRNYSVFRNDVQIAAFTKNRISIGKGDRYDIRVNADANFPVVICLSLAVDLSENENNDTGASVIVDLGNIGPEARPFDSSWEPNNQS